MPVCARCTGIYVGAAVAAIAFRISEAVRHDAVRLKADITFSRTTVGRTEVPRHDFLDLAQSVGNSGVAQDFSAKVALILTLIPMMATLVYEWTTGHMPANWIRAAAGTPVGGAIAWIIGSAPAAMPARERASAIGARHRRAGVGPREKVSKVN